MLIELVFLENWLENLNSGRMEQVFCKNEPLKLFLSNYGKFEVRSKRLELNCLFSCGWKFATVVSIILSKICYKATFKVHLNIQTFSFFLRFLCRVKLYHPKACFLWLTSFLTFPHRKQINHHSLLTTRKKP